MLQKWLPSAPSEWCWKCWNVSLSGVSCRQRVRPCKMDCASDLIASVLRRISPALNVSCAGMPDFCFYTCAPCLSRHKRLWKAGHKYVHICTMHTMLSCRQTACAAWRVYAQRSRCAEPIFSFCLHTCPNLSKFIKSMHGFWSITPKTAGNICTTFWQ